MANFEVEELSLLILVLVVTALLDEEVLSVE